METGRPEIRVDVDESNLSNLRVGQEAVVTSPAFAHARLAARVVEVSPQVDPTRGTVEVTIVPEEPPAWLRPGLTVDVNLITARSQPRLVVPRTALRSQGDRQVVLVVRDGRAQVQPVVIGRVEGSRVPVVEGLEATDLVVANAEAVEPGARVRISQGSG